MFEIIPLETPSLGDRSYLATDGKVAVVIDPQRDFDRVIDILDERDLQLTHVFETHIHNDYVTGGYALAQATGAAYVVNADDDVAFERTPVSDGDIFEAGGLRVRAMHTPGHTFTHMSYVLEADGDVAAVFSGGSLLYGSTGRPDLLGAEHAETLARHQHASAHRIASELPAQTQLFPTHGFGSFCSSSQSEATAATVGDEVRGNIALTLPVDAYVEQLLAGLDAYPAYYAHMGPANSAGPGAPDLSPVVEADADELRRRIDAGEWVVDLRTRTAFAAGHVPGTVNIGADGSFVTYLGWLLPWGDPVTLLGETAEQVAEAQRDLARIGIDRPAAAATGGPEQWLDGRPAASLRIANFGDLHSELANGTDLVVLDVRRNDERSDSHILGSVHIPIHELPQRLDEVPTGHTVWVHCAAGYRAAVAASLLSRAGRDVVAVDDDYDNARTSDLDTIPVAA
jgi:glyoxylase-like metal-dependent hydrolase (beta-lactamase superfamily II)/rhodanese-related sulfurtransferase